MLTLLFAVIFVACLGFLYPEGIWSNALRLINLVMAGLIAFNYWEPAAAYAYSYEPSFTYFWDFLAIWAIFSLSFSVLRALTDAASRYKVRFLKLADRIGSGLLSMWIGWLMICFLAATLHMAPLPRESFNGAFVPEKRAASIFSPDMLWLGFVQQASMGVYARTPPDDDPELYVFDPSGDFMPKYAARRSRFEQLVKESNRLRIHSEEASEHY
ncbi:MAG: CvpA family protein [Planctomycetota bacterium]